MTILKRLMVGVLLPVLALLLSACSSGGGGGGNPGTVNATTWDELVWDDGANDATRQWAD